MKNKIDNDKIRKTTSLIIMTIMVAGGLTFAIPGTPVAHAATENLFVSAENSLFDNSIAGPMVVEIVVNDPDLKDVDSLESEPDVTVNGQDIQMVQATDGNWYAYFAEASMAEAADLIGINGESLDFGTFCTEGSADAATDDDATDAAVSLTSYSDTDGVYFEDATCGNEATGTPTGSLPDDRNDNQNVLREQKTPTAEGNGGVTLGQVGLAPNEFPAIQVFNFAVDGTIEVKYNKGGGEQQIDLVYLDDADGYAGLSLDREDYPPGASVHFTITDLQLNIDPTDEDSWTFSTPFGATETRYQVFDENGESQGGAGDHPDIPLSTLNFDDNGALILYPNKENHEFGDLLQLQDNTEQVLSSDVENGIAELATATVTLDDGTAITDIDAGAAPVTITETQSNSGIFKNTDEGDIANIVVHADAPRGVSASIDYNLSEKSIFVTNYFGSIEFGKDGVGDAWNSGEQISITLTDGDINRNSLVDEDLDLFDSNVPLIPSVRIGSPVTLAGTTGVTIEGGNAANIGSSEVQAFSDRMLIVVNSSITVTAPLTLTFDKGDGTVLRDFFDGASNDTVHHFLNYDLRSFGDVDSDIGTLTFSVNNGTEVDIATSEGLQGLVLLDETDLTIVERGFLGEDLTVEIVDFGEDIPAATYPIAIDFFSYGQIGDGVAPGDRVNNAIYRLELEESGDNTGVFIGSLEFLMLNQLNVNDPNSYIPNLDVISDDAEMIIHNDLTDEDSVRINYLDFGEDGVATQVADQVEAPTHSGVVSFDSNNYKIADTVTVTLEDPDLNTDVEVRDIFTVVRNTSGTTSFNVDVVGTDDNPADNLGRLLDITFDDELWTSAERNGCFGDNPADDGLGATGFTMAETTKASGIFTGTFQIPTVYCPADTSGTEEIPGYVSTTGVDLEVNYVDYRDLSGEIIEVGDSAGIRANTGSVSFDKTVYPVPFGTVGETDGVADFDPESGSGPSGRAIFPVHVASIGSDGIQPDETIQNGDLTIHVRVNDPDYDISGSGEDMIADGARGPIEVSVSRGSETVILATAGGEASSGTHLTVGTEPEDNQYEFGPIAEIAPDAGIFELDLPVRYTDGPSSNNCPNTDNFENVADGSRGNSTVRFNGDTERNYCILQGDILTVIYTDPTDASGEENTVTDSATFDLRNGILQSDKSAYIIGGDMILTLIEPDLDLENDERETYTLDLIEWDSDDAALTMGILGGQDTAFDPEPSAFRETGDSTGIFQVVIEIPEALSESNLDRGEAIELEYTDWGPSGANYVGDEDEDVNLTVLTSNFGATIELDQKVYTWTDKVYITILAPDHNFDSDLIDEIGETREDVVRVNTGEGDLDQYRLTETGPDTGIFTGEVILTGFLHDADGDTTTGNDLGQDVGFAIPANYESDGQGPTNGLLSATEDDGVTVSFEFSEDETVIGSSLIRWNLGEVSWLEASYAASSTGTVRVIDPDMNWNPESVDNFDIDVRSDSDSGGIDLTVTETNQATGIFEGTVTFSLTEDSSGHRLRVAEGDTVKAEYDDNTLPDLPDRTYSPSDEVQITGTTFIGTIVPPLERLVINDPRVVDGQGNPLASISVDTRVHFEADLISGQDKEQDYAYLVQIEDANGVIIKLDWSGGVMPAGGSQNAAQSWIPDTPGAYTVTMFAWESVSNPTALSPKAVIDINVV